MNNIPEDEYIHLLDKADDYIIDLCRPMPLAEAIDWIADVIHRMQAMQAGMQADIDRGES